MENVGIIPVYSETIKSLTTVDIRFNGLIPEIVNVRELFEDAKYKLHNDGDERGKIMILDVRGLIKKSINEKLVKNLKTRGFEVWFMTSIRITEDTFDAFNTDAEMVFMPLHLVKDFNELSDICEITDSTVPTIFVSGGKGYSFDGEADISEIAGFLFDMGFQSVCVFDLDESVSEEKWKELFSTGYIIPFTRKNVESEFRLTSDYF